MVFLSYAFNNQDIALISKCLDIDQGTYILFQKCFNRQEYNYLKNIGVIEIDETRLCRRWCLAYLSCMIFVTIIWIGFFATILLL